MNIHHIAAFTRDAMGGNPAGVVLAQEMPTASQMQRLAAEIGYSETAFAIAQADSDRAYRVRYFSPESEVPFCGHASIALGAVLAAEIGNGAFQLTLNDAEIQVESRETAAGPEIVLQSPPTRSEKAAPDLLADALALFGYGAADLDARLAPGLANAGANHLILPLKSRDLVARMDYDLDAGRTMMRRHDLVTIALVFAEADQQFHVRNAFASGGVVEDPATGAAAAALSGMLRDVGWPHGGQIEIEQGVEMGRPSRIRVEIPERPGTPVRVSGAASIIEV